MICPVVNKENKMLEKLGGENINQHIKGYYRDVFVDENNQVLWDTLWRSNLIVQNCNVLMASLMKRHEAMQGILYWAVGKGLPDWDSNNPNRVSTTSKLNNEVARKAISAEQIVYINEANTPAENPTNRLEVTMEFKGEDVVSSGSLSLREFGLFGGDATEISDSGFLVNHVIHPRIDMTPGLKLIRKLRLTFSSGILHEEELSNIIAELQVSSIDGIGDKYSGDLNSRGINSIGELVKINPLNRIGNIPQIKLIEFYTKAKMLMRLRISIVPLDQLSDYSISNILMESPENLVNVINKPGITPEIIRHLQEELAVLQVALDDDKLQDITAGDLLNA